MGKAKYLCVLLPFPPSLNGLFPGKQRRFKSAAYKAWIERAGWALNAQDTSHFSTPVEETISLERPVTKAGKPKKWDLANFEKAVNDLLVDHHVLMDDSLIHKLTMQWDDKIVGAMVEIEERA